MGVAGEGKGWGQAEHAANRLHHRESFNRKMIKFSNRQGLPERDTVNTSTRQPELKDEGVKRDVP